MILEKSVLLTWFFLTHNNSSHSLVEIQEHLRKELSCQARYREPRELGTVAGNPQTMETFAVLNLLRHPGASSCLKAHKMLERGGRFARLFFLVL